MKRWMVRLAALSTVVLACLVLLAHAYKGRPQQPPVEKTENADSAAPGIKLIPIAPESEQGPATTDSIAKLPSHADESRYVEQPEPSEAATGRYSQSAYQQQPAGEESADEQEPRKLDSSDEAEQIPVPRNPFTRRGSQDPAHGHVERTATAESTDETSDSAAVPADAGPSEALTADVADEQPKEGPSPGGRYGNRATSSRAMPIVKPGNTPFGEIAKSTDDSSAFEPPAGRIPRATASIGNGRPGDRKLEGAQSPSLVIEKTAPGEIQVGKPATFSIRVRNAGQVPAGGVEIHDQVPQGTELVSTKPSTADDGGKLLWQLGTLKPGDETTVEMQVMPVTEGEIGSVASVTFRADISARSKATRPQLKLEVTAPDKVLIGENAALRIRITNPGTGPATGVMLTEKVPAGFKHENGSQQLEFEVGTLAPGENRELELALQAVQPGVVTNQLLAEGDANLRAEDQDEIEVIAPAIKIGIQGPKRRFLQRKATYNIAITNPGTAPAKNIELVATLPRGLKFVEANNSGHYDSTSHAVSWSLDTLSAGQSGTVALTTIPIEPGDLKLQVAGKAAMNLADSLEEEISVEGLAAIFFELVDVNDPIEVGGETTYEIRVINQGSAAATGVRLVALLPAEMKALDADGPVSHTIEQGRVLFEPLSQLAPKADTMYTLKVQGAAAGDLRLKVQIVTDQITTPVTKEESTRVYSDE